VAREFGVIAAKWSSLDELSYSPLRCLVRTCRQALKRMWIYVALGIGIVVALNTLIVVVVTFAAQHARAEPNVEELDAELRALLLSHVRPLNSRDDEAWASHNRQAA
jgi:hypothetical protein